MWMVIRPMDEVQEWFTQSEYDLGSAGAMFDSGRYIYAVFMCHLAVEKALKGLVIQQTGKAPPRSHNLVELAGLAQPALTLAERKFLSRLSAAGVSTRYPEELSKALEDYPVDVVRGYIAETREVVACLKSQVT